MSEKILITSALPYANGPLHFGHIAGAYLPADCYARFQRLMKKDVLFICGSDEYGIAITLSAEMAGRTPQEHVDLFHKINKDFFEKLQISFDHYSRTTWEGHVEAVHQYFNDLLNNGYIEARVTDQLFSEKDQKFLADRYVVGTCPKCGFENARGDECPRCGASYEAIDLKNPRSKITEAPLVRKPTKHWFLLLDKFKDRLNEWLETKKWKPNVINFIKGYINELHARSITRDTSWGIPVPLAGAEGKVLYVWFDAPIGYISATKEWAQKIGHEDRWKDFWLDSNTKLVNFIGKDNIPFHASIFPAMTMGQNQPYKLVDELAANEFYNLEGRQFSKSDGWFIDLEDFFGRFSTDQIRYAIASNAPETADSEFTWRDFQLRCNTDLLGKYGNLANRVLIFIQNNCEGKVPAKGVLESVDKEFLAKIDELVDQAAAAFDGFKVRRASQILMELAQLGNIYFDAKKPWQDAKSAETRVRLNTTLYCCLECLKALVLVSYPIIPATATKLWGFLGYENGLNELSWNAIKQLPILEKHALPKPTLLFLRVEDEIIEDEIQKLHSLSKKHNSVNDKPNDQKVIESLKAQIDIDDFKKLDIRSGIVLKAEPVPKSKKLLQLEVDLGFEKRTVVAGIGESYSPEQVVGASVVILANLKPTVLMGIKSEGMLLAVKGNSTLKILSAGEMPPGSIVS